MTHEKPWSLDTEDGDHGNTIPVGNPAIHESNGWQFKNSPDGVMYRFEEEGPWWPAQDSPRGFIAAYSKLCPLPPDPPTLEHEGVLWTRDERGYWVSPSASCWNGSTTASLLDRIAKQGDYAEDTE